MLPQCFLPCNPTLRLRRDAGRTLGAHWPVWLRWLLGGWVVWCLTTAGLRALVPWGFLLNTTGSLPLGFYRVYPPRPPWTRGMLVVFPAPPSVAGLIVERGWLPPQIPLLKPLAALPGDTVCVTDDSLAINHRRVGAVTSVDTQGRPLPHWHGCRVLAPDEVFPASLGQRRSFDGRYFGPIRVTTIQQIAEPLWTFTW